MFRSARVRLTAWYLIIIMTVSIVFSVVIFRMFSNEVERFERMHRLRIERGFQEQMIVPDIGMFRRLTEANRIASPPMIAEVRSRVLTILIVANGSILITSAWLGYILAGITLKPIQDMVERQSRFVSDASHELKTPLASLKIAFEVYLRTKAKTVKESVILIQESLQEVDKLQSLTESLLSLARYPIVGKPLHRERVGLREVTDEAIKSIQHLAHAKSIHIVTSIVDTYIVADHQSIVILLRSLLDNAIKYSDRGKEIRIESKVIDDRVRIKLTDQGIGIPQEDLALIFDRFYRADKARSSTGTGGHGLGLSIAKEIVQSHGGTIEVVSERGKGSTFTIELPLGASDQS